MTQRQTSVFVLLAALLMLPGAAPGSQPKGRYQQAVISDEGGVLCLRANDVPELKRAASIVTNLTIYHRQGGAQRPIWSQSYPPNEVAPPVISPGDCMDDVGTEENPLPALVPGVEYSAEVAAFIVDKSGSQVRRWYSGHFCMLRSEGGFEVRQVLFDRRRGVWGWDACGL